MPKLLIDKQSLSYVELQVFYKHFNDTVVSLDEELYDAINASAEEVTRVLAADKVVYGINTGFGMLASKKIPSEDLRTLQKSLVLSHATGVGEELSNAEVALVILLKVQSLTRGYSGIRLAVIERLIAFINHGIYPCIPSKGSVGASGDLAPLAHLACAVIGEGDVTYQGKRCNSLEALAAANLTPLKLEAKEGLALLNGTNVSTALGLKNLFGIENCLKNAIVSGAMTVDAALGSYAPFDARIQAIRGHQGQIDIAATFRNLLHDSELNSSHENCDRVQDPYSLRCQPQVMGACLDQIRFAAQTLIIEANAVSDNPLVFADSGDIVSGGNFHAEPVAMACDNLAIAISEIGAISERRISLLLDKHLSNLPAFLVDNSGVNSGFMIAQVTAAALASENKAMAHPASVDSIPTSANQEDHVSMATFSARRLAEMLENVNNIIAIELLCAAQGIDFRAPLQTAPVLSKVHQLIRQEVTFYSEDRYFATDINAARNMVTSGELCRDVKLSIA